MSRILHATSFQAAETAAASAAAAAATAAAAAAAAAEAAAAAAAAAAIWYLVCYVGGDAAPSPSVKRETPKSSREAGARFT